MHFQVDVGEIICRRKIAEIVLIFAKVLDSYQRNEYNRINI